MLEAGDRVGRWTLLEYRAGAQPRSRSGKPHGPRVRAAWRCVCDCGTERWVLPDNLTRGLSTGCRGCHVNGRRLLEYEVGQGSAEGLRLQSVFGSLMPT